MVCKCARNILNELNKFLIDPRTFPTDHPEKLPIIRDEVKTFVVSRIQVKTL